MPVETVVLRLVLLVEGGTLDISVNPVGITITGMPTRFPTHTFSQSVAFPITASTLLKLSLTSPINFPLALCACKYHN